MRYFYNQTGRSMIEMLGVLAIIAVLSVGGIAGYSKAMEMYKEDKVIEEYSYMLTGFIEHLDNLRRNKYERQTGMVDFALSANIVPSVWTRLSSDYINDSFGNKLRIYMGTSGNLVIDFWMGGKTKKFDTKFCRKFLNKVAFPLHQTLKQIYVHRNENGNLNSIIWKGDNFCSAGQKCLRDITLTEIDAACKTCVEDRELCAVIFWL